MLPPFASPASPLYLFSLSMCLSLPFSFSPLCPPNFLTQASKMPPSELPQPPLPCQFLGLHFSQENFASQNYPCAEKGLKSLILCAELDSGKETRMRPKNAVLKDLVAGKTGRSCSGSFLWSRLLISDWAHWLFCEEMESLNLLVMEYFQQVEVFLLIYKRLL